MLGVVAAVSVASPDHPRLTFHCSFDDTTAPEVHVGDGEVQVTGEVEYENGVAGRALVCGDGKAALRIPRDGNYSLKESTVAFWVKPLDWEDTDEHFHIFFQASSSLPGGEGRGARLLYKYLAPGRFLQLCIPDEEIPYVNYQGVAYADISSWKPGEWHHVVGAWRGDGFKLYLDGNAVGGKTYYPMPMSMGDHFEFGDRTWQEGRDAHSLLDELMIFDNRLSRIRQNHNRRGMNLAPLVRLERACPVGTRRRPDVFDCVEHVGAPAVAQPDECGPSSSLYECRDAAARETQLDGSAASPSL